MKQLISVLLCLFALFCGAQNKKGPSLLTEKYTGTYSYGSNPAKEAIGSIIVYPETDSTILFYIDLNRGAPSYNMGALYGRLKIKNDSGIFFSKAESINGCKWKFKFSGKKLTVKTLEDKYDCGFGHNVAADGGFKLISPRKEEYFQTMEGTKVYFQKTKPEDYYRDPR